MCVYIYYPIFLLYISPFDKNPWDPRDISWAFSPRRRSERPRTSSAAATAAPGTRKWTAKGPQTSALWRLGHDVRKLLYYTAYIYHHIYIYNHIYIYDIYIYIHMRYTYIYIYTYMIYIYIYMRYTYIYMRYGCILMLYNSRAMILFFNYILIYDMY